MMIRMTVLSLIIGSGAFVFAQKSDREKSVALFNQALKVFRHPRCMNCHPAGDRPTQGNDMHEHAMNVMRGPKDHGALALNCKACHGVENNVQSGVPGASKWALAPKSMGWQGLTDRQLCQALKDPKKNHGMSMEKFIAHNAEDPLVGWAWNPGGKREPVPGTQKEFGQVVADWVATGAHCP